MISIKIYPQKNFL